MHVEIKDPLFFNQHLNLNTSVEELVVSELLANGCEDAPDSACFVQCFNLESLRVVRNLTKLPLFYLTEDQNELADNDNLDRFMYSCFFNYLINLSIRFGNGAKKHFVSDQHGNVFKIKLINLQNTNVFYFILLENLPDELNT